MQHGQAVAEHCRGGDQDEDDGQSVDALVQSVPDALPVEALVDEDGDQQRVDNCDSSGLGSSEHTADNAEHDDDDCGQSQMEVPSCLMKPLMVKGEPLDNSL